MAKSKLRIDERLVADGLAPSRSHAQRLIMAGSVLVDGLRCDKASRMVTAEQRVTLAAREPFVSRAGRKLDNGLSAFANTMEQQEMSVAGSCALDLGASTGGFTDCLLQHGAAHVVAVDVGYGQLDSRLRGDPRVTVMERTNARHLTSDDLPYAADIVVCDASFISLRTLLPGPLATLAPNAWGVLLIKPQFEAGPQRMRAHGRGGVLRDAEVRAEVVAEVQDGLRELGLELLGCTEADPPGPKGNIEYVQLCRWPR